MNKISLYIITLLISFFVFGCGASNHEDDVVDNEYVTIELLLSSLEAVVTQENIEELFVAVTSYSTKNQPSHQEVPSFPRYWLSSHLDKVKNVLIWQGNILSQEKVTIHLSLIERDAPPFDVDDLIGTIIITLNNTEKGVMVSAVHKDMHGDVKHSPMQLNELEDINFDFMASEDHHYRGVLTVKTK